MGYLPTDKSREILHCQTSEDPSLVTGSVRTDAYAECQVVFLSEACLEKQQVTTLTCVWVQAYPQSFWLPFCLDGRSGALMGVVEQFLKLTYLCKVGTHALHPCWQQARRCNNFFLINIVNIWEMIETCGGVVDIFFVHVH